MQERIMQKKFGTVLDDKLLNEAKLFSQKEHTTIGRLIQESLSEFLERKKHLYSPFSAVDASFGVLKIESKKVKNILNEDLYETICD